MALKISSWTTVSKGDGNDAEFIAPHPGAYLQDVLLPRLGISPDELAAHLDMPSREITALLRNHTPITIELAERLGAAFENGSKFWLELQRSYDDWRIERYVTAQRDMIEHAKQTRGAAKSCERDRPNPADYKRGIA